MTNDRKSPSPILLDRRNEEKMNVERSTLNIQSAYGGNRKKRGKGGTRIKK